MQIAEQNGNKLAAYDDGRVSYNGVFIDTGKPTLGTSMQLVSAGVFLGLALGFVIFG